MKLRTEKKLCNSIRASHFMVVHLLLHVSTKLDQRKYANKLFSFFLPPSIHSVRWLGHHWCVFFLYSFVFLLQFPFTNIQLEKLSTLLTIANTQKINGIAFIHIEYNRLKNGQTMGCRLVHFFFSKQKKIWQIVVNKKKKVKQNALSLLCES